MHRLTPGCCLLALCVVAGCGPEELPYNDTSQDPEAYAQNVKLLVVRSVESARTSREPAEDIRPIIEELEQTDRPHGSYAATYAEILNIARPLVEEMEKAGGNRPPGMDQKLNELMKIAGALPGEVPTAEPDEQ